MVIELSTIVFPLIMDQTGQYLSSAKAKNKINEKIDTKNGIRTF